MEENGCGKKFSAVSAVKIICMVLGVLLLCVFLSYHFFFVRPYGLSPGMKYVRSPSYKKGKDWNGDCLWYGGIKWRVLSKYDILLLADHIPEDYCEEWSKISYMREDPEEEYVDVHWENSVVREYLNTDFYSSAFMPQERDAMLYKYEYGAWEMPEDKIFILLWRDVVSADYGFSEENLQRSYDEDWWLSELGGDVYVADSGEIIKWEDRREVYGEKAVRPAFYLDGESIVFTRDVSLNLNRPPSPVLADTRLEGDPSGEWVSVLSSASQHVTISDIRLEGDVCTMAYSNASCGSGQYLSAVITDGEENIRYYGRLIETDSESEGIVSVQLPDHYKKSWNLRIFSENPKEGTMTSYASDPIAVLEGREPAAGELISEGRCDPDHQPEPLNMIINRYYDRYLDWYAEDYEAADEEGKHEAATAAMLYTMLSKADNQLLQEGKYTGGEIRDGAQYADEHPEDVRMLAETIFVQAGRDNMTMKEVMDRNYSQEYSGAYEGEIDLGEYTKYMDYTGAMFAEAEKYEQENVLIACVLYLGRYRMGEEISEEYAAELAEEIRHPETLPEGMAVTLESLQGLIEMNPEMTVRETMNLEVNFRQ